MLACLATTATASALYGATEAPADAGTAAVRFEWRSGRNSGSCSGALVHPRVVLTAAHCVRSVTFGTHQVRSARVGNPRGRTTSAAVASVRVHARFDVEHPERGYDVALLVLAIAVTDHAPLRLARAADDPTDQGTALTIAGFGRTRADRNPSRSAALRTAVLEHLSPFHCFSGAVNEMAATRMCAASPTAGVCPGDSGAAATMMRDGSPVVVGVVSLAIDATTCAETAAVLTRVSAMRDFIDGGIAAL
jgi:secreted trypsin-like serine protease